MSWEPAQVLLVLALFPSGARVLMLGEHTLKGNSQLRPHPWSFCSINLGLPTHNSPRPATEGTGAEGETLPHTCPSLAWGSSSSPFISIQPHLPPRLLVFCFFFFNSSSLFLSSSSSFIPCGLMSFYSSMLILLSSALGEIPFPLQM